MPHLGHARRKAEFSATVGQLTPDAPSSVPTCMDLSSSSTLFACSWRPAIFSRAAPEADNPFFCTLSQPVGEEKIGKERRQTSCGQLSTKR